MASHPYLNFNGNCREAMLFYQRCFGGDLTFQFLRDTPGSNAMPERIGNLVVQGVLNAQAVKIYASDIGLSETLVNGNRVSLLLKASDQAELQKIYHALSGDISISPRFTTGELTQVTDPFGVHWLICY